MKVRGLFRRNAQLGVIRGYQRAASGAEAAPIVTQAVHTVNSALIAKRDGLIRQIR